MAVEWLIVERDSEDVRRLLVITVDDYPQVGSHDLDLYPGGERLGNARCGLGTWLDAATFRQELRTGFLQPDAVARILQKRTEIAAPTFAASLLGEEVDGDPGYRRWLQETQQAVATLEDAAARHWRNADVAAPMVATAVVETVGREGDGQGSARRIRTRWLSSSGPLAVAVMVLLAIVAVSTWHVGTLQVQEVRQLLVAQQYETTRLDGEKEDLELSLQALQDQVTSIEQESARSVNELEQRLHATQMQAVEPNIAFAFLRSEGASRGQPLTLAIDPEARRVALFVPVVDPEWYSAYRMDLVDRQTKSTVWSADDLVLTQAVLTVSLPTTLLDSDGEYELRLAGITDEGPKPLEERYLIDVSRR